MAEKQTKFPMVQVVWHDALHPGNDGWEDIENFQRDPEPHEVEILTTGHLLWMSKKWVRVAVSVDPTSGHCTGVMLIPRGMVVSITHLRCL